MGDLDRLDLALADLEIWIEKRLQSAFTTDWPAGGGLRTARAVVEARKAVAALKDYQP